LSVESGLIPGVKLPGKVAHVTGAGAGIGRAIALCLAREGAAVAVSDIDEAGGAETVSQIESNGGRAVFVHADVAEEEDIRRALARTEEVFGGLDVLVNNAGGAPEPHFPDAEPEHWLRQIGVNLLGVMLGTHYAIAAMKRGGGGAIVNISSRAGEGFRPYVAPEYAAAKAAIWRFSAALGSLAETHRIRVNCICPDWVEVESMQAARLALGEEAWAEVAPARLVPPEEIAEVVLLLASEETLAGRVVLCPHDGPWGVVSLGETFRTEALPGLPR
jgi:NAD(P)-dependent dehydrogenase (short-subunit alcohol dehydrogenase family)